MSESLYSDIKEYVKRKNVFICPNGIPIVNEDLDSQKILSDNTFRILFLSNMMEAKGVWDLLDACKLLKERNVKYHCDFIGKWSDIKEEDFNKKLEELGLSDYVTAHGSKYGDDKNKFFIKANVFVFPTYYHNECFPLVLLEAMQYGMPCISTHEGGISDVISDQKTGFIVVKRNPNEIADRIQLFIDNPDLSVEMGMKAKEKFDKLFTLDKFEENMKEILEQNIRHCD